MLIEQLATAIDCEGYIGINMLRHPKWVIRYAARIGLAMQHPAIPNALHSRFGGSLRIQHNPKGNFDLWRWSAVGNIQVGPILNELLPHLVVKKAQAENVLAFLDVYKNSNRWSKRSLEDTDMMKDFWLKAKALNRPAPATTERETPVTGSDSLALQETAS